MYIQLIPCLAGLSVDPPVNLPAMPDPDDADHEPIVLDGVEDSPKA